MAGLYPDPLGHRMAYDLDGTVGLFLRLSDNAILATFSQGQLRELNDEDSGEVALSGGADTHYAICLIFPELRDIVGSHWSGVLHRFASVVSFEYSSNTTNGIDGTWTTNAPAPTADAFSITGMRTGIQARSIMGVKAVRFRVFSGNSSTNFWRPAVIHLYGAPSTGQDLDRLRLWHPTLDEEVGPAYFDWGDAPRSSSADRQFRVKNNSVTVTATTPTVSVEALSDTIPSVAGQHLFSLDGVNFAATQVLPTLAPGEISGQITLRRNLATDASLSLWWARVAAVAASWEVAI